jgi:hypothetical protein
MTTAGPVAVPAGVGPDVGPDGPARTMGFAGLGLATVALAPLPIVYLDLTSREQVSPFTHTISDHVNEPQGAALLAVSAICALVAGVALVAGLGGAGLQRRVGVQLLLASWCVAAVLAVVFPTNAAGTPAELAAQVHRYAVGWMFAVLPAAMWLLARRSRNQARWRSGAPLLGGLAVTTAVAGGAFLLSHIPIVLFGSPGFALVGVVERVLFGMEIALLVAGLVTARRAARSTDGVA